MKKTEVRLIAKALVSRVADCIDVYAFGECSDIISNKEVDQIIDAIKLERENLLSFIDKRIEYTDPASTRNIVKEILKIN